jgi:hypothetical protein
MAKVTVQVAKKVTRKKAVTKKAPAKKAAKKTAKKASKKTSKKDSIVVSKKSRAVSSAQIARVHQSIASARSAVSGARTGAKYALNGLPWVLAVGLGSLLFAKSRESAGAQTPIAPIPGLEPVSPSPAPAPAPKPSAPDLSAQERLDLDFRRAKTTEIPRDILQKAKRHINEPIGAIIFETSTVNGKEYAFVLEQHSNLKLGDGGVSVFIHR